jgi:N-acetyl-anhydromuramyl-L-alanine amidase AmpD
MFLENPVIYDNTPVICHIFFKMIDFSSTPDWLKNVIYDISKYYFIHKNNCVVRVVFSFKRA